MSARKRRVLAALFSAGTFVLGVIAQPAIGLALDSTLTSSQRLSIAVVFAAVVVLALVTAVFFVLHDTVEDSINRLTQDVAAIERRSGIRVEFSTHTDPHRPANPYAVMIRLVESAQREIIVLDHRPTSVAPRFSGVTLKDASRQRYYDLLNEKLKRKAPDGRYIRYRRIVQLPNGPTSVWDTSVNGDETFASHCREVIQFRANVPQCPSAIKTSSVFYPNASIVVVDERLVLLEVAISGPDGNTRIEGDLVFHDADGVFAGPLRQLIDSIDSQSTLVTTVKL